MVLCEYHELSPAVVSVKVRGCGGLMIRTGGAQIDGTVQLLANFEPRINRFQYLNDLDYQAAHSGPL